MSTFTPVGQLKKAHEALSLTVDGWTLGTLVIAAADVPKMLNGHAVNVQFVQERPTARSSSATLARPGSPGPGRRSTFGSRAGS